MRPRTISEARGTDQLEAALSEGRLQEARKLMHGKHDWLAVVAALPNDSTVIQSALDLQFEYYNPPDWDGYFAYAGGLEAVRVVVERGAKPGYEHLLGAARQGRTETVSYFLDLGVSISDPTADDQPL